MMERLDVVVFGATGFTGKFTLPYIYKLSQSGERTLSWGVAGRSEQKLKYVLNESTEKIGTTDLSSIPIIIADVENEDSIKSMTAQAKVIVNCCGPFHLYGEMVVKACIESKTHYVDVSGESQFIERMELKYAKAAEGNGVYIVSACGFDSVPSDLGTVFLERHFEGLINSVEVYLHAYQEGGFSSGPTTNYGTWASAVYSVGSFFSLFSLRRKLYPGALPPLQPKLSLKLLHKMEDKWAIPFPATDYDVLKRSQRYFYENNKKRPIQVNCYVLMDSFRSAMLCIFFGAIFALLSFFKLGRYLLLKYPEFFSCGFFSHKSPSVKSVEKQHFSFTLHGKGWNEKNIDGKCTLSTNKTMVARVSGINPGYGFTCFCLALCATMILNQSNKLPPKGGVFTPAVAFSQTSLIEELQRYGATFEIISNKKD